MQLDEKTRARLRGLADQGPAELDESARGRIARRIASDGPGVVRRARRVRMGVQLSSAGVGLALCCAGLWLSQREAATDSLIAVSSPATPVAAPHAAATANVSPRACERRAPVAVAPSAVAGGAQRFDLGELGTLVATPGSAAALEVSDPCRVRVRLDDGSVAVHAADLGGGELSVATPSGEVRVHGTVFAVTERKGVLTVDVDEGRVSVTRPGGAAPVVLDAGTRLRAPRGGDAATEPLAAADRAALRLAVGLVQEPAPVRRHGEPSVAPDAEALVSEADGLWRAGELERARDRYRRAGALSGVTAEAAWLALARRELSVSRAAAARAVLANYRARFPRGKLMGEALGIDFRAAVQLGDRTAAQRIAGELQRRHPGTPQADAAARWSKEQARDAR